MGDKGFTCPPICEICWKIYWVAHCNSLLCGGESQTSARCREKERASRHQCELLWSVCGMRCCGSLKPSDQTSGNSEFVMSSLRLFCQQCCLARWDTAMTVKPNGSEPSKLWPTTPTWINGSLAVRLWKLLRKNATWAEKRNEESVSCQTNTTKSKNNIKQKQKGTMGTTIAFKENQKKNAKNLKISRNISKNLSYFLKGGFARLGSVLQILMAREKSQKISKNL